MGYEPRLFEPGVIQFITSRTIEQTLFMVPTPAITNVIGAALAHQQQRHRIELFGFISLSNHMHLCARAPRGNLPDFMRDLKSSIAVGVNRIIGRRGHFWERRYMASPILDEDAQVERAIYIYGDGPKEGLVDRPEHWPGIASVKLRLSGDSVEYDLIDHPAMSRAAFRLFRRSIHAKTWMMQPKSQSCPRTASAASPPRLWRRHVRSNQQQNPADYTRKVTLQVSPWPWMAKLTSSQQRSRTGELVEDAVEKAAAVRRGKPSLGVAKVLTQDPRSRPRSTKRSPKPLCHASTPQRRKAFRKQYAWFVVAYEAASKRFRAGDVTTVFPLHSYKPPLPRTWSPHFGADLPPPVPG